MSVIRIVERLILSLSAVAFLSCEKAGEPQLIEVCVQSGQLQAKSKDPDVTRISDLNLFVFSEDGFLEERRYLSSRELDKAGGKISISIPLVRGIPECIVCCANFGYEISGISTFEALAGSRYSLAYPDEYSMGMPMTGMIRKVWGTDEKTVTVSLERMMAKISVAMDRTELSNNVKLTVKGVRIGNCPRSASVMGPSHTAGTQDVFATGFVKSYSQVDAMNIEDSPGISKEVSVYMLENMMGDLLDDTVDDKGKIIDGGLASSCSYIEIECEYVSDRQNTRPGEYLKYRFYLGESNYNFDTQRNCHYHYMVQPSGDGLRESSWRIDKTALE